MSIIRLLLMWCGNKMRHVRAIYAIGLLVLLASAGVFFLIPASANAPEKATSTPGKVAKEATTTKIVKETKVAAPLARPPLHFKSTMTTLFWAGEPSDSDNGYIANDQSYWDEKWMEHFGGLDDPTCRAGFRPCAFKPKENPFYVALPYGDYSDDGLKDSARRVPWFSKDDKPLLKNRWVEVRYGDKRCYAQWEDVGPFETDDWSYVFGESNSANTYGERAGLDVSPAVWTCLGLSDNAITSWAFIDEGSVPSGPWIETVTTSGTFWTN